MFTVSLPVIFINAPASASHLNLPDIVNVTGDRGNSFTVLDIIGGTFFVIGLLIETIADFQKFFFKDNPENRGKWCNVGKLRLEAQYTMKFCCYYLPLFAIVFRSSFIRKMVSRNLFRY